MRLQRLQLALQKEYTSWSEMAIGGGIFKCIMSTSISNLIENLVFVCVIDNKTSLVM